MNEFFHGLEKKYNFRITKKPIRLSGGYTHKMYALHTTKGNYAIKLLNPFIMKREDAMSNYAVADQLELLLEERAIPILPSLSFEGKKMQEMDGQYFYLFDYFEGKALTGNEITDYHCSEMGSVLAQIHNIDTKQTDVSPKITQIDWDFYIRELEKNDKALYDLIHSNYTIILASQENGNRARKKLPQISAICHNDMDAKNVLWKEKEYRIIDLECLAYSHPMVELFELALCWAGYEECNIDFTRMKFFLKGYYKAGGHLPTDWQVMYDCNNGRLEWLEYNIKRVLGIDCGADEKELGINQVVETVNHIVYYDSVREQIIENCMEVLFMEKWDAYNSNFEKIGGKVLIRGEESRIPAGVYHLVCDVIVKHTDGDYLLMKRDARKHYGGMWEATAGGSALIGESPLQCAVRELREETGIEALTLTELGTEFNDKTHCIYVEFLCATNWDKENIQMQAGETVDYKWVSRDELLAMDNKELVTTRIQKYIDELKR